MKTEKKRFKLLLRFIRLLLPYSDKWLTILILSCVVVLLDVVNPYLTKLIVDRGIGKRDIRIFIILVLIAGGVLVLNGLINSLKRLLEKYIKVRVNFELNKKVFNHLQEFSFDYFTNKSSSENLYKINYDIEMIAEFMATVLSNAITIFPSFLLILGIVFFINWRMAVFPLILNPFFYFPAYYFTKKVKMAWKDLVENNQNIFKNLSETLSHIQLIKIFGKETESRNSYFKALVINTKIRVKNIKLEIAAGFACNVLNRVMIGIVAFYGGYLVIKKQMSLGSLTAIMVYLGQLPGLQNQIVTFLQTLALGLVSCERIAQILDNNNKVIESKDAIDAVFSNGQIEFRNVSFGYIATRPILSGINLRIESGSCVALAGASGCGKTTMLNLILRLYDPHREGIFINGYDIRELTLSSLRWQIGVVPQEPFLWDDTIENNIRYGNPNTSEKEITEIAKICGVDEFVNKLPDGYKTIIGENACKISEGQKQKIAIARALIKKPKILFLDEAMSSMDSASEESILANIKQTQKYLTLIIVSHRLSTIMSTDMVYYLEGPGKMVIDTPQNLLERNSNFASLFVGQRGAGVKKAQNNPPN